MGLEIVALRVLPIVIRSASPNTPNSVSSTRCQRRGAGDRPDKAGELACDGDTDFVDVNAAALQMSKASAQTDLGLPGMATDGFGLALLTVTEELAQSRRIAVLPRRFGEKAARMGIAGLGDATAAHGVAAGVLGGHQSEVAHQMPRMGKALDVADFRDQANGADGVDTAQRAQGRHDRCKAPSATGLYQCLIQAAQAFVGSLRRQDIFGERQLIASVFERLIGQPVRVGLVPGGLARIESGRGAAGKP